jgi:hypothetical protein
MRRLLLALLLVLVGATPAQAQVTVADPADAPGSVYDVEALTVAYDPTGSVTLTWRLHAPFPAAPPQAGPALLSASVYQQPDYFLGCRATGVPGDLDVLLDFSATEGAVPEWDAGYHVFGREGMTEVPVTFSADRREARVAITDPAIAGRPYFCAGAMSEDGARDFTGAAHFPGFEPLAPVLGGPADGALFHGTTPDLDWDVRPASGESFEVYRRDPATGGAPLIASDATGRNAIGGVVGTRTGTSFRLAKPLEEGVYWWGVRRSYGFTALKAYKRFEVGPPDLTTLKLARSVGRAGAKLTVKATRGATGVLVVKRGARTVKTLKFTIKTDKTSPRLTVPLPCSKPGRYTAKVTASDRYGKRLSAAKAWTVSRSRCAR